MVGTANVFDDLYAQAQNVVFKGAACCGPATFKLLRDELYGKDRFDQVYVELAYVKIVVSEEAPEGRLWPLL
jgi:hypothetical protein